jgi:hypothetical protein
MATELTFDSTLRGGVHQHPSTHHCNTTFTPPKLLPAPYQVLTACHTPFDAETPDGVATHCPCFAMHGKVRSSAKFMPSARTSGRSVHLEALCDGPQLVCRLRPPLHRAAGCDEVRRACSRATGQGVAGNIADAGGDSRQMRDGCKPSYMSCCFEHQLS